MMATVGLLKVRECLRKRVGGGGRGRGRAGDKEEGGRGRGRAGDKGEREREREV